MKLITKAKQIRAKLRNRLLRMKMWTLGIDRMGSVAVSHRFPKLINEGSMQIGDGFFSRAPIIAAQLITAPGGRLKLGAHATLNEGVIIASTDLIEIGEHVKIGDFTTIHDSDYHPIDSVSAIRVSPIRIGRNVWIGRNVTILPGVEIRDNSVIGAGAVVMRSVPKDTVATGNPARPVARNLTFLPGFIRC